MAVTGYATFPVTAIWTKMIMPVFVLLGDPARGRSVMPLSSEETYCLFSVHQVSHLHHVSHHSERVRGGRTPTPTFAHACAQEHVRTPLKTNQPKTKNAPRGREGGGGRDGHRKSIGQCGGSAMLGSAGRIIHPSAVRVHSTSSLATTRRTSALRSSLPGLKTEGGGLPLRGTQGGGSPLLRKLPRKSDEALAQHLGSRTHP